MKGQISASGIDFVLGHLVYVDLNDEDANMFIFGLGQILWFRTLDFIADTEGEPHLRHPKLAWTREESHESHATPMPPEIICTALNREANVYNNFMNGQCTWHILNFQHLAKNCRAHRDEPCHRHRQKANHSTMDCRQPEFLPCERCGPHAWPVIQGLPEDSNVRWPPWSVLGAWAPCTTQFVQLLPPTSWGGGPYLRVILQAGLSCSSHRRAMPGRAREDPQASRQGLQEMLCWAKASKEGVLTP